MALIKYYNLESSSWDVVSDLERNLMKHLLSEKHVKGILQTNVEEIAEANAGNGDKDTLTHLLYDSGEFDVLYKNSWTISKGKRRWFRENIAPRIGTELVVKATPEDILALQEYLAGSGFEVVEARGISRATFSFTTCPAHEEHTANYGKMLSEFIQRFYSNINYQIEKNDKVEWDKQYGSTCVGMCEGQVIDILKLRSFVKSSASTFGCSLKRNSSTFS